MGAGASAPDLININNTGIYLYGFAGAATTEQLYGSFEIPHNYKEGTDLVLHVHWLTTTTNIGNVKWQVDYWRVDMTTITTVPSTPLNIVALGAADGTAWKNNRIDATTVSGANIKIGDQVAFRLYRNPTDAQDTYPDDACVITFGIHYQIDTLGSRNITTK